MPGEPRGGSALEHILLGLLKEPATGYELKGRFETRVRGFWSAELSQIYPTLKRLETRGLLRSRTAPSPKGPARRVYRRTPKGRRALLDWLRSEPHVGTERFAYLAQLYFMGELDDLDETREFLLTLRGRLAAWVESLRQTEREIRELHGPPEHYSGEGLHQFASLRMGIHSIGAKVAWCDETLALVDARRARRDRDRTEEEDS